MSKVVEFLEELGRNPELLSEQHYIAAVSGLHLDEESAAIMLSRDASRITEMLRAPAITFCGLMPAEEEQPVKEDEDEDGDGSESKESSALAA